MHYAAHAGEAYGIFREYMFCGSIIHSAFDRTIYTAVRLRKRMRKRYGFY